MIEPRFFVTGGTLQLDAESYVARSADRALYEALRQGDLCYVLTSRQMGKSSLMVRNAAQLRKEGVAVVIVDLTAVGQNLDVEQWYLGLLDRIGEQLGMEDELERYWEKNDRDPPMLRWMKALREVVLVRWQSNLVIFVDEIDYVRSLPFKADEFFAGIREAYNRRTQDAELSRMTFCLIGVATPADLIRDQMMTPFNVGRAIELRDFTPAEAAVLADGLHGNKGKARDLLKQILYWTNGHPYLTQRLCLEVAKRNADSTRAIDQICADIFLSARARERDDNLHFVRERLVHSEKDQAALLDLYAQVLRGRQIVDDDLDPLIASLRLSGVVGVDRGRLVVRNRIYREVFHLPWVRANLPDAERERQRAAFWRGARRAFAYSALLIALMTALAVVAWKSRQTKAHLAKQLEASASRLESIAEEKGNLADEMSRLAVEKTQLANTADSLKKEVVADLITKQEKIVKLLEAIGPLLGSASPSREKILECAKELQEIGSFDESGVPEVQLGQADLFRVYSSLYVKLGQDEQAFTQAEQAREIVTRWVEKNPNNLALQRRLVDCYNAIGDAILGGRDPENLNKRSTAAFEKATSAYEAGLALAREILKSEPGNREWQELVLSSWNNIGDVQLALSWPDKAERSYHSAYELNSELVREAPGVNELEESLAGTCDRLGDLFLSLGRSSEALQYFQKSFETRTANLKRAPEEKQAAAKSALATSYNKLGKACAEEIDHAEALRNYEAALKIREELQQQDPRNLELLRNLAYSYNNVGGALLRGSHNPGSNFQKGIELFEKRLVLSRQLYEEDPSNSAWRIDYAEGLHKYAHSLLNVGSRNLARWRTALEKSRSAVEISNWSEPRYLCVFAQAQRLNGMSQEGRSTLSRAFDLLPPPDARTPQQKSLAADLQRELNASEREQRTRRR